MITAIVFDCFGVLVAESWLAFKDKHFKDNLQLMEQASELNRQSDAGLITHLDFLEAVAKLANITVPQLQAEIDTNPPNEALLAYIQHELKPAYKIGMLSNAASDWLQEMLTPKHLELFDAIVLSYDSGVIKPDRAAYELIASRLDVQPEDCIFIDDQERHCRGAREVGMHAILYKDVAQTITDIKKRLSAN